MDFLTDQEAETLIMALARGQATFTEADGKAVIEWANQIKLMDGLLQNALEGHLDIVVENGEVAFRANAKGVKHAENLIREAGGKV